MAAKLRKHGGQFSWYFRVLGVGFSKHCQFNAMSSKTFGPNSFFKTCFNVSRHFKQRFLRVPDNLRQNSDGAREVLCNSLDLLTISLYKVKSLMNLPAIT